MTNRRAIPSIEQLRQRPLMRALEATYGRTALVEVLRLAANDVRERIAGGDASLDAIETIERSAELRLRAIVRPSLRGVINATGVIIHTNLGRAPLSAAAVDRVARLAAGYANLEFDLALGQRGRRDRHAEPLLCRLTGAAAALIVNNNAAAILLALAALAKGREVIISRGELVEIGGGFRVPDVMAQSGAILREVGTTNRTRIADYAAAISDRTALLLRVHPSNFRIEGFSERPPLHDLVALGRRFSIPVVEDLGSGFLGVPERVGALRSEPDVQASIHQGVDLVLFSGDKLLGGPQAGVLAGTERIVSEVRRHPLMRAVRADKMTYAALEATLEDYVTGRAEERIPVARMIAAPAEAIGRRAESLAESLNAAGCTAHVIEGSSTIGGGSAPGSMLPTRLVALTHPSFTVDALESGLRRTDPPVIARIEQDRVLFDLRTVFPEQDDLLAQLIRDTCSAPL